MCSWTAVLRGAVLHGLARTNHTSSIKVTVASRVSRHSYGTLVNILPFDAKEHDTKDQVWDEGQREFLAVEQTRWFVEIVSQMGPFMLTSNFSRVPLYLHMTPFVHPSGRTLRAPTMISKSTSLPQTLLLPRPARTIQSNLCVSSRRPNFPDGIPYQCGPTKLARYSTE